MNKYKTVKQMCALTGLTRKHLYYFHHENIVRAVAYANYSVEGNDGYKLYDDAAVEKLLQIALYYQLGLKRNEIRDLMRDTCYDSNRVLDDLLAREQAKLLQVRRHIAALEYLRLTGTKNGVVSSLQGISLDELGEILLTLKEPAEPNCGLSAVPSNVFRDELAQLLRELSCIPESSLAEPAGTEIIRKICLLSREYFGCSGELFLLGLFVSMVGEGTIAQEIDAKITPSHAAAVIRHITAHPELHTSLPQQSPAENK